MPNYFNDSLKINDFTYDNTGFDFMHPKHYFDQGFFYENEVNPDLLGKFAKSSANDLMKHCVPVPILEAAYFHLYESFEEERLDNHVEDISDIMRARIFCEPFVHYQFLIELIDAGLLAVESEQDIEAFFVHFHKIIDLCKYGNLEGVIEY